MLLVKAFCFSTVAALDFPQGAPVDWEDGPLPSTRAAWVLVDAKAAQTQLPWQLAECGVAGVAFSLCVILTWLCWRHGLLCSNRRHLESLPSQEVDLEAGLCDWDARCEWDARCASQDPTSTRQDPVNQVAWSVSKIQGWLKARAARKTFLRKRAACCRIQRAWRTQPLDRSGAKMLQDFAKRAVQPPFYNLSDFDPEDLLEEKFEEGATWRAIQTAPALFQQAPASAARASSFEGFEACRLTLARLSGDVGTATVSDEELQEEPRLH